MLPHYSYIIMSAMPSLITSLSIVYSSVRSGADQRKYQSPASLAFGRGIHRGPVNSPHKWPVTRKMFSFDDVIMAYFISSPFDSYTFHKWNGTYKNHPTEELLNWLALFKLTGKSMLADQWGAAELTSNYAGIGTSHNRPQSVLQSQKSRGNGTSLSVTWNWWDQNCYCYRMCVFSNIRYSPGA